MTGQGMTELDMTELGMTRDSADATGGAPCDASSAWIDDYVDGELELARVVEVEAHLEVCAPCRRDVDAMQDLLQQVEALPSEQAPPRDVWHAIAPRLGERPAAPEKPSTMSGPRSTGSSWTPDGWRFWAGQAVAAGLFLLLGFGAAQFGSEADPNSPRLIEGAPTYASVEGDASSGVLPAGLAQGSPSFLVAEAEFLRAKEALLMSALQRREAMSPESLELLYRNLQVIDAATVELRHALSLDPANPRLEGWVLDNYRRELSLLKRLTSQDA